MKSPGKRIGQQRCRKIFRFPKLRHDFSQNECLESLCWAASRLELSTPCDVVFVTALFNISVVEKCRSLTRTKMSEQWYERLHMVDILSLLSQNFGILSVIFKPSGSLLAKSGYGCFALQKVQRDKTFARHYGTLSYISLSAGSVCWAEHCEEIMSATRHKLLR